MSRPLSEAELAAQAMDLPTLLAWARREYARDEEEMDWTPISTFQSRSTPEALSLSLALCRAPNPDDRALGICLISHLGKREGRPFFRQTLRQLHRHLKAETRVDLLYLAAVGVEEHFPWNWGDFRTLPTLLRLASHGDEGVRYGVARALASCDRPESIQCLIRLSNDLDEDVRDWATFGLGTQLELDTEEIRAALWARGERHWKDWPSGGYPASRKP